ncbi:MAG: peptidoglycan-binding protein, partial [Gemmatimonadota bacterium]|nr:peptidoglycan-binding protein [Gemmatimonadota bacterium]
MNPTVRYGSRGEHVVKLQEGLNQLPSALARLTTDGIYGQKSIARVREFQGKNGLVPDGIVGPNTWGVFLQLVAQIVAKLPAAPPTPTTAMFALMRPQVIGFARGFVGRVDFSVMVNGRPKGIDLIKNIFAKAANTPLTDDNFRKGDGTWTWVPIVGGKPKSWCGIFCVHCYRLAGF